jgi:purine-binding chemotaxis protein CheW
MSSDIPRRIVIFSIDPWQIGVRLEAIEQVVRAVEITPLPDAPRFILGVIDVRGRILPAVSGRQLFGCPERELSVSDEFILLRAAGRDLALVVDRVHGVAELSNEAFTEAEQVTPGLESMQGIAHFKDGLVLVEDLDRFLSPSDESALTKALAQ